MQIVRHGKPFGKIKPSAQSALKSATSDFPIANPAGMVEASLRLSGGGVNAKVVEC